MQRRQAIPIDSKRALVALAASNTLGMLALYMIPLIIGATADGFGKNEGTAGIVSSWELGVMAAVSTLLAARYKRLDLRRWVWIGALAYVTGNLLSYWSVTEGRWPRPGPRWPIIASSRSRLILRCTFVTPRAHGSGDPMRIRTGCSGSTCQKASTYPSIRKPSSIKSRGS